jgi:hypothetical protein
MKEVKAGISMRTGKPYPAFMACPNKCKQPYTNSYNNSPAPAQPENDKVQSIVLMADEITFLRNEMKDMKILMEQRFAELAKFLRDSMGAE